MKMHNRPVTRRDMLAALTVVGLSACSTPRVQGSPGGARTGAKPTLSSPPAQGASLPRARSYVPLRDEIRPRCKEAAARAIEQALTWSDSQGNAISRRLSGTPAAARVADMLRPLVTDDAASVASVIYPQYGGLNSALTKASVMVVGRQTLLGQGEDRPRVREFIVDVRLSASSGVWSVSSATVGIAPSPGELGPEARALLDNPRIRLPEPARADVAAAVISPDVVALLNTLSQSWRLDVHVLRTGHPRNVFGTNRVSNHTRGRAVDIRAINGIPVIGAERSLWEPVAKEAARLGSTEVGAPGLPEKTTKLPPVFFTNPTHKDHLHLGFEPKKPS